MNKSLESREIKLFSPKRIDSIGRKNTCPKYCLQFSYPTLARSHRWCAALYITKSVASKWIHTHWRSIILCVRVAHAMWPYVRLYGSALSLSGHPSDRLAAHNPHTCSSDGHILHPQSTRCGSAGYTIQDIETKHGEDGLQGCLVPLYVH